LKQNDAVAGCRNISRRRFQVHINNSTTPRLLYFCISSNPERILAADFNEKNGGQLTLPAARLLYCYNVFDSQLW